PIRRWSILSMSATTVFRSTTLALRTCLRLKASSWLVSVAARLPACLISVSSSRAGAVCGKSSSRISLQPVTTVSRLLKSWATPLGPAAGRLHLLRLAEALLGLPQGLVALVPLDGDAGDVGGHVDQLQVLRRRGARLAAVQGEGGQHLAGGGEDRGRPAGAQ